jgi:K(+)-stimulated pyrophosphate-energized sodium pump
MSLTLIAIICGVLAVVYGFVTSRQVLGASAGNEKMQEIAAAIQEGRKPIWVVSIAPSPSSAWSLPYWSLYFLGVIPTIGFVIGAVLSGVAGYIGMNISVRSNVRTAAAAQTGLQAGLTMAFRAGAITGMLVAGLALLAIAVFFWYLTGPGHDGPEQTAPWSRRCRAGLRRFADLDLRASRRRHLHQGR